MIPQTDEISKLLVRAVALVGLASAFEPDSANWTIIERDLQHLYISAFNFTEGCGSAEELYFIGITIMALNNHDRFDNVTYLSGFFPNYLDDWAQFPTNMTR